MVEVVQIFPMRQLMHSVNLLVREESSVHAYYMAEHGRVAPVRRRFNNFEARVFTDGRRARVRAARLRAALSRAALAVGPSRCEFGARASLPRMPRQGSLTTGPCRERIGALDFS